MIHPSGVISFISFINKTNFNSNVDVATILLVFLFGLIVGAISSRFGIGGGIITIPFLRIVMGLPGQAAIATALPLTIPTALAGAFVYHKKKLIRYKTALTAGLVGAVFAVAGAYATIFFSSEHLMTIMAFLFFVLAYIILYEPKKREKSSPTNNLEKILSSVLIGAIAGFSSGFLGIGGGVILVPLLVLVRRMPMKEAIPTSLATIAIYAVPGSIVHYMLGNVHVDLLMVLLAGSVIGAYLSAKETIKINEKELKKSFAALLIFLGILLLLNEYVFPIVLATVL